MGSVRRWIFSAILFGWLQTSIAAAEPLPDQVTIRGVEFVRIPAGWYVHTSGRELPDGGWDYEDLRIWLDEYYIARYEALATDFAAFLNVEGSPHSSRYREGGKVCGVEADAEGRWVASGPRLPAAGLTWFEAAAFAEFLDFRLPTEMEWEKAARGTDARQWPWGNQEPDDTTASFRKAGIDCASEPVDQYRKGISPYGIHGMAGGVREPVRDRFNGGADGRLVDGSRNPPPPPFGEFDPVTGEPLRVVKGGCWSNISANSLRIFARTSATEDRRSRCYGVRFSLDAAAVRRHLQAGQ